MPRYHYECTKCGHAYDLLEGWDAKPQKRCPECRSKAIRIPKAPAIVFKGKGFYASDNRSSSFESKRRAEETGDSGGGDTAPAGDNGAEPSGGKKAKAASGDAPSSSASNAAKK